MLEMIIEAIVTVPVWWVGIGGLICIYKYLMNEVIECYSSDVPAAESECR